MLHLLLACTSPAPSDKPADDTAAPDTADTDTGDTGVDPYADLKQEVGRAMRGALRSNNASGAAIAVWKDGAIVYAEGFGTKDPDDEAALVGVDTLFQIGSDTKKMTAIVALQQVQAGTVTLDDDLATLVPGLAFASDPSLAGSITLHELLSHQTGLFDYTPWVEAPDDADLRDRATGRLADNEYAMGPSGLYWNYSNPGFSLAGLVTEEATGRMWPDLVEDDLFAPLGLTRTFARRASVETDDDYAIGYGIRLPNGHDTFDPLGALDYEVGTVALDETLDCGFTRPAGLVWSTASDMARFAGFLVDGDATILDPTLHDALTTPHVAMYPGIEPTDLGYGYGLMVNQRGWSGAAGYYEGVELWAHGGNTMSFTSATYAVPEQRVAVVVLSNGYGDDFGLAAITALEGFADLPTPGEAPAFLDPPENVEEVAGTWVDPHALGTLTLTWDGADLLVDAPDLEAAGYAVADALEPYAKDYYLLRVDGVDYDFAFYRGEDGTHYLVNRQFTFLRAGDVAARPAPPRERMRAALRSWELDPRAQMARLLR